MKIALARLTLLVCGSLMILNLMFAGIGYARINLETCIGIWLLDEGEGDVAENSFGNANDGELVGNPKWVEGKFGKALEFDGTNHVRIPANAATDDYLEGFTYLLWVKPLATPGGPHIRLIERDWHNPNILIGPTDFYGSIVFKGGIDNSQIRGGSWQMEEWSFVALTFDGKTLSLYVDGEMVGDLKVGKPDFTNKADGGAVWLARWKKPGWDFTGVIDEVAIFNVALEQGDLQAIMNQGLERVLLTAVSPSAKLPTIWALIKSQ